MNDENLKPFQERSESERREIAARGGKASGAARRKKRDLKGVIKMLLDGEVQNKKGETATRREVVAISLIDSAMRGNVKATKLVAELSGEMPDKKIEAALAVSGGKKKGNRPVVIQFVDAGDDGCSPDK